MMSQPFNHPPSPHHSFLSLLPSCHLRSHPIPGVNEVSDRSGERRPVARGEQERMIDGRVVERVGELFTRDLDSPPTICLSPTLSSSLLTLSTLLRLMSLVTPFLIPTPHPSERVSEDGVGGCGTGGGMGTSEEGDGTKRRTIDPSHLPIPLVSSLPPLLTLLSSPFGSLVTRVA